MSIFEHMTWGLGTPNLPKLGARAILQRGYVDFLGDRAGMYGEPDEAWRAECEARWVMRQPREQRAAYYEDVKKKRGEASLSKLIEDVREQWKKSCS